MLNKYKRNLCSGILSLTLVAFSPLAVAQASSILAESPAAAQEELFDKHHDRTEHGSSDVEVDESIFEVSETATPYVSILMDSGHRIVVELDDRFAKKTVENFQKLVADHFYDGLIFHRVIDGFMIQGGDPDGTGRGGASEKIEGEFELNGVENPLSHRRGVISMARSMDPNSASSQFFICNADTPQLDGQYASFGWVIYGMGEVDRIAKLEKDDMDRPTTPPVIKEIRFLSKSSAEALLEKLAEAK